MRNQLIASWQQPDSLAGAILIGDIPYVVFEQMEYDNDGDSVYADYPRDIFLMDMNGDWQDILTDVAVRPANGKYDTWPANRQLEIWVCRLSVHKVSWLGAAEVVTEQVLRARPAISPETASARHGVLFY